MTLEQTNIHCNSQAALGCRSPRYCNRTFASFAINTKGIDALVRAALFIGAPSVLIADNNLSRNDHGIAAAARLESALSAISTHATQPKVYSEHEECIRFRSTLGVQFPNATSVLKAVIGGDTAPAALPAA